MKRRTLLVIICTLVAFAPAFAQNEEAPAKKEMKTGWTLSALPSVSYSSDMGFQYGAFGEVYNYGDGSTYPDPLHLIKWEVSHFTKGRTRFFLAYDSKYLIPNMRLNCSATYITDPLYYFYGFNGNAQSYLPELDANNGLAYYNMNRNMLRLLLDFQGKITPNLSWAGGISFWRFNMGSFNGEKYGYDPNVTLYNYYKKAGIIKEGEADGGSRLELKAGFVYDSRDVENASNRGIWSELYLSGSPDIAKDGFNYLKLNAHFRHYLTIPINIKAGKPVFAYHLAYQGTIAGETPFYMQQNITTLVLKQMVSEGIGSSNTIRGLMANRVIADGYAWGNFELRVKLVRFQLFKQYFYIATNPFFDCGIITQPYRLDEMAGKTLLDGRAFGSKAQLTDLSKEFIKTAGIGLKIAWNENFIVSVEGAKNFNKGLSSPNADGDGSKTWISIGMNYCF